MISDRGGPDCSVDLKPCIDPNPCKNSGKCTETGTGLQITFTCACNLPWKGSKCEEKIKICDGVTCSGQGTCKVISEVTRECICNQGRSGLDCEFDLTPCEPNPCSNEGQCSEIRAGGKLIAFCQCESGWKGKYCREQVDDRKGGNGNGSGGKNSAKKYGPSFILVILICALCKYDFLL